MKVRHIPLQFKGVGSVRICTGKMSVNDIARKLYSYEKIILREITYIWSLYDYMAVKFICTTAIVS